ncbi:MAG: hypothetical protein RLZZ414_1840 [Bacteroidota bacterium]|jgi:hypothetical protein
MKTKITLFSLLLSLNLLAKEFTGSVTLGQLNVKVTLNDETNKAKIELTGPSNSWFSIGFGNRSMNNTYAIFANETLGGNVSERILGNRTYGNAISSITSLESYTTSGATATYIIERPLLATNGGFNFNAQAGSIDIILAIGPNQTAGAYHGGSRTGTSINLVEVIPTSDIKITNEKFIKAFPNPTNSLLNIEWNEIAKLTSIKITTVEGKIVQELTVENVKNHVLDVSALPKATYFLIVQNNEWNSNFTFIKE